MIYPTNYLPLRIAVRTFSIFSSSFPSLSPPVSSPGSRGLGTHAFFVNQLRIIGALQGPETKNTAEDKCCTSGEKQQRRDGENRESDKIWRERETSVRRFGRK